MSNTHGSNPVDAHSSGSTEHLVPRANAHLYVRDYAGKGPAYVLMHGFPDNFHIYDRLIPLLRGRHVVTFDFLGWGASEKPSDYNYTSKNQEGDLDAVVEFLHLEQVIPVAHDASGPVAINWSLDHAERIASLVLLNTYYGEAPTLRFPEFINLFADPTYAALAQAFVQDPEKIRWLLSWQGHQFGQGPVGPEALLAMVWPQFASVPSTFPAFMSLTRDLYATVQADTARASHLATFDRPVSIIFGAGDPYLNSGVAQSFHELFPTSQMSLLKKGHWPQLDGPDEVASLLLSLPLS